MGDDVIRRWTADSIDESHLEYLTSDPDICVRHTASAALFCDDREERKRCREQLARILNERDVDAANGYHSYMRGWRDGAVVTAMRKEFLELPETAPNRQAYELGYGHGRRARGEAAEHASKTFGHEPSILRLAR